MNTLTMNMFEDYNTPDPAEDGMPPIEEQVYWSNGGYDGYHRGCSIAISQTTTGQHRIQLDNGAYGYRLNYMPTLEAAQAWAITECDALVIAEASRDEEYRRR